MSRSRPPAPLSALIGLLIPPRDRDAVMGDLEERYRSPAQFASEGIRTMPHLVASQARRTTSVAILGLQAFVLVACLGVTLPDLPADAMPSWVQGGIPTLAALAALLLRAVYRGNEGPARSGLLDAVAAAAAILLSQAVLAGLVSAGTIGPGWLLPPILYLLGVFALPALWIIGAAEGRNRLVPPAPQGQKPLEAVVQDYLQFERQVRSRNRVEIATLGLTVILSAAFLLRFNPPVAPVGWTFLAIFAAILVFLALRGGARPLPAGAGFEPLRSHYRRELTRQNRLRGFMWWFWFAPLFAGLATNLVLLGMRIDQPLRIAIGGASLLLLAGFILKAHRDRTRAVRERIAAMEPAPA